MRLILRQSVKFDPFIRVLSFLKSNFGEEIIFTFIRFSRR